MIAATNYAKLLPQHEKAATFFSHTKSFFVQDKTGKISLIKTVVYRALMICSKAKLGPELGKIEQLFIENGYLADVLLSCINQKLANFAAEKTFGPKKCPVYLELSLIGNVSSKCENQISRAITSCYYAVKPIRRRRKLLSMWKECCRFFMLW